ncbi:DMT family transporter [Dactylosporangium sp. NPDC000244]|uniref:DMT family transporter n=1 Tax=Dactylosporangium sp. NPDC000244 TaxID=3154365 RepID=UPI00331D9948
MVYALALSAAAFVGIGNAVQQRSAARAPSGAVLHWRLLGYLLHQRLWLAGIATSVVGNVLSGAALGLGSVAEVEPLSVMAVLFAMGVAAVWSRYRVGWREWSGATAVVVGVIVFLLVARPGPGQADAPVWQWALAATSIGAITAALVSLARRMRPQHEAAVLSLGAGMLFGLQAALTSTAARRLFDRGLLPMLVDWTPYAVVVIAVIGILLAQSAFKLAPLPVSYPPVAAAEPLAGVAIGIGVLEGTMRITPIALVIEIVALAMMTVGVYALASSRLVEAHHHAHHRPHLPHRHRHPPRA